MLLSKPTMYGIQALAYLAGRPHRFCGLREIAGRIAAPPIYLGKILGELRRHRLLVSVRGIHGGYRLGRDPAAISFGQVFRILEPDPHIGTCLLDGSCLSGNPCAVHREWLLLREEILRFLDQRRISQLGATFDGDAPNTRPEPSDAEAEIDLKEQRR